jgi:beta-glucanase (GH16 family)
VIPDDRWTNAGSPNATDYLGVDFGGPRELTEVKIYTYDDGQNVRVPQKFDVQYLSGSTWTSVPGQINSPASPVANDSNEVTFPAVSSSQIRVVFTPQPGKSVGVTELESWYPRP